MHLRKRLHSSTAMGAGAHPDNSLRGWLLQSEQGPPETLIFLRDGRIGHRGQEDARVLQVEGHICAKA